MISGWHMTDGEQCLQKVLGLNNKVLLKWNDKLGRSEITWCDVDKA